MSTRKRSDEWDAPEYCSESASFRVSVCLRRYFSDERARAFVLVRCARRRRVGWLERRLRALFGLRSAFCLRAGGHLLPRDEPLRVLRAGDRVEVFPLPTENSGDGAVASGGSARDTETLSARDTERLSGDDTERLSGDDTERLSARDTERLSARDTALAASSPTDVVDARDYNALLDVKRRALQLLDAHCRPAHDKPAQEDQCAPRKRRRVRRRPQRAATPPAALQLPPPPAALQLPPPPAALQLPPPPATARSPSPARAASVSVERAGEGGATPRDVTRNEDACARKARMIHSLGP